VSVSACAAFLWQQSEVDLLKGTEFEFEPRVNYSQPVLALEDQSAAALAAKPEAALAAVSNEHPKGEVAAAGEHNDERVRPAPARLGTFDPAMAKPRSGPPPVTVGKALASGSSSLLQAMNEESRASFERLGAWPPHMHPPPHSSMPPHHGLPPQADWRFPPPPMGFFPPPSGPGYPPHFHPHPFGGAGLPSSGPQHHPQHFAAESPPPGFFGGAPPPGWEGAAAWSGERRRSESRSRKRRRR